MCLERVYHLPNASLCPSTFIHRFVHRVFRECRRVLEGYGKAEHPFVLKAPPDYMSLWTNMTTGVLSCLIRPAMAPHLPAYLTRLAKVEGRYPLNLLARSSGTICSKGALCWDHARYPRTDHQKSIKPKHCIDVNISYVESMRMLEVGGDIPPLSIPPLHGLALLRLRGAVPDTDLDDPGNGRR